MAVLLEFRAMYKTTFWQLYHLLPTTIYYRDLAPLEYKCGTAHRPLVLNHIW